MRIRPNAARYLLVLMGLAIAPLAGAGPEAMTALAERYYALALERTGGGLPDAALREQLSPLLGSRLRQVLEDAVAAERRYVDATPAGDKPALIEGDVLTGIYEGGHEVALADPEPAEGGGTLDATVVHVDPRFAKGHRHRVAVSIDRLRFGMENGEIRIVDVQLDRARAGAGNGLVQTLADYIKAAPVAR